jgi:hypothetical protein
MPVPLNPIAAPGLRDLLRRLLGVALFIGISSPLFAKGPEPPLRIPLDPLGFQPVLSQFLVAGSSLFTIHYVDDQHLLLTFTVRRLMTRLPNDPEDDQDRNVDALLLELPTGHILARTSWRLHDHGQYLWDLGHGRFLLRIRDNLTTFAPLLNLSTAQPFRERPFLAITGNRRLAAVILSPDTNLLIAETVQRTPTAPKPVTPLFGPTPSSPEQPTEPASVQINFYRLLATSDASDEIKPRVAGIARSSTTGSIASTTAGYLAIIDQGHQHWAFDFDSYTGKTNELSPFDSTCRPSPFFVSRSEFIAFGCKGGNARQLLGGFNMRGQEMWEQNLFGEYFAPFLAFAPSSGRFAFSRVLLRSSTVPDQPASADEFSAQSVVVYQTSSGKQILHAECSPIERAGQNFALSPNGMSLALIHTDAIEIYSLPPLTTKESTEVKLAEASAPQENDLPIQFGTADQSLPDADVGSSPQPAPAASESIPSSSVPNGNSPSDTTTNISGIPASSEPQPVIDKTPSGDPSPEQRRKPPTLYTLPGDPPHTPPDDQQPK